MSRNNQAARAHQISVHPLGRTKGFFICIGLACCCNVLIFSSTLFYMPRPLNQPAQIDIPPHLLAMLLAVSIVVPYVVILGTYLLVERSQIRRKNALRYKRLQRICNSSAGPTRLPHRCLELKMMGGYFTWFIYQRAIRKMPPGHVVICRMANTPRLRTSKPINVGFEPIDLTATTKADLAVIASLRDPDHNGPETGDDKRSFGQLVFDAFNSQSRIVKVLYLFFISYCLYQFFDLGLTLFQIWRDGRELPFGLAGKYALMGLLSALVVMLFAARNRFYLAPGIIAKHTSSLLHRSATLRIFSTQNASLIVNTVPAPMFENDMESNSELLGDVSHIFIGGLNHKPQTVNTIPDVVIGAWLSSVTPPTEMQLLSSLQADRVIN